MQSQQVPEGADFLRPHISGTEQIILPSGATIDISKYSFTFKLWLGAPVPNSYGNKAVIDSDGEPLFAELAALRLFQKNGWKGVWVDSYHRKYRVGLPDVVEPVMLPERLENIVQSIKKKTDQSGGCWDVLVWRGGDLVFVELKRTKKDRIKDTQVIWLQVALENGFSVDNFALIEWNTDSPIL